MSGMTAEISQMLHNIREVKHLLEDIFDDDYEKHTSIDKTLIAMDLKDVKMVVNNYGILEIIAKISNEYGVGFVTEILKTPIDNQYRCLIYYILDEFVNEEIINF